MAEEVILINSNDKISLKKAIARRLYEKNIDQSKISLILELSQPMVSNYISSKEKISKNISKQANQISDKIIDGNFIKFQICIIFNNKPTIGKYLLAQKNEIISDENIKIVDNLSEAFRLLKGKNITRLIPEIKINIAMAKEKADSKDDIAAFLNGLIIIDDKITSINGIRFGRSKHLSSLLLELKKKVTVNAIMNIAYFNELENLDFNIGFLTKDYKLKDSKSKIDILLHKGDFGIEPCAYVLGRDAIEVSKKILRIIDRV
jgi:predicted fused transcriptional regulator/phosphomethylpyrimidine kinase